MVNNKVRVIAFYLPQFHPIVENDEWWGKGFTEWRCVSEAKKLFPGHDQPRIPMDLGYYDLRVPETREDQAQMAKDAGIEGFCYWHYWFGEGKQLLERPFNEVVESGKPDFPFCLGWGNHSWRKNLWDKHGNSQVLIEQRYLGIEDDKQHFYSLLKAFKDPRYIKVDGKCLFFVHSTANLEAMSSFISHWREFASENGLKGFYFVARDADSRKKNLIIKAGFDAIYNDDTQNIHHHMWTIHKVWLYVLREWFHMPTIINYKKAMKYMIVDDCKSINTLPMIAPNWDHSPRSGGKALLLYNAKPKYFYELVKIALNAVNDKPDEHKIIVLKSWNEWGEGNYMEPDKTYGHGYLNALKAALNGEKYEDR